jgi:hypothetical protein
MAGVLCVDSTLNHSRLAGMNASGNTTLCAQHASGLINTCFGNFDKRTPVSKVGDEVTYKRFSCEVLADGVQCVVTATGNGFLIRSAGVTSVGGGVVAPEPKAP